MFRSFVLFLVFISACFVGNAQQINKKGLKMVSKIEFFTGKDKLYRLLSFTYNSESELVGLECTATCDRIVWRKENGELKCVLYDEMGEIAKNCQYFYELDEENGYISKRCSEYYGDIFKRHTEEYFYDYDNDTTLCYMLERGYHGSLKQNLIEEPDRLFSEVVRDENGDFTYTHPWGFLWREGQYPDKCKRFWNKCIYDEKENDTNININAVFDCGLDRKFKGCEFITEWHNMRSKHLLLRSNYKSDASCFNYEYAFDSKGNIVQIDYYRFGRMHGYVKIYY